MPSPQKRFKRKQPSGQIRRMNQMMNSMFRDPFADMFGGGIFGGPTLMLPGPPGHPSGPPVHGGGHPSRHHRHPANHENYGPGAMAPFGTFPNLRHVFEMANPAAGGAQFSSMQVMTMTSGPDGRPQIYQASSSTRHGPNGVRETKKTVADSRTGLKKMSVGHHINDRAHIIEREQNVYSGDQEERQEFINLDEEEVETFDTEWKEKTRGMRRNEAIGYGNGRQRHGPRDGSRNDMLALPAAPSSSSSSGRVPPRVTPRRSIQSGSSEPKTKAAAIAENSGDERGKKRPVIVEIDSDTDEPKTKSVRRSSEDEVTITEVTSDSEDETASH
uniref:Myeloid leukemia factor n=1 Tax=Lygus hesperus TaxID=30085 RepID=A0A0K8TCV9_LYGHE